MPINESDKRRIGSDILSRMTEVNKPSTVARMMGTTKQNIHIITIRALYKIAAKMKGLL